ncbi:unnamed protein product [Cochlearia groenlandica]
MLHFTSEVELGDECQHDYAHLKDKDKPPHSEEIQGVADEEKCTQVDTSQLQFKDIAPFLEANKTQAEEEPQDLPCEVNIVTTMN